MLEIIIELIKFVVVVCFVRGNWLFVVLKWECVVYWRRVWCDCVFVFLIWVI